MSVDDMVNSILLGDNVKAKENLDSALKQRILGSIEDTKYNVVPDIFEPNEEEEN